MTQFNIRLLFYVIIITAVILILVILMGVFFSVRYITADVGKPIDVSPWKTTPSHIPLGKEHITAIAVIITPSILLIVNITLAMITFYYATQTKRMADENEKQTRISTIRFREQQQLKNQKRKILKVLYELPPTHVYPLEELAILTGIDPDVIEDPLIVMIGEGLIELNSFGYYVLKRGK